MFQLAEKLALSSDAFDLNNTPDQVDSLSKYTRKCPGCKNPHKEHSWGDPGPYCTGSPDHLLDPSSHLKSEKHEMVENVDEKQLLAEQLQKLKLEEERLPKDECIQTLKQAIAAQKRKLVALQTPGFLEQLLPYNIINVSLEIKW